MRRFFFVSLAFLEGAVCLFLALSKSMPVSHDTFLYFASQYYFLNEAVTSGEIPRWLPFFMQGSAATWWYTLQSSLLQLPLLHTGAFLKGVDFLNIFYASLWVDHLFLLAGVWLLSKRFFSPPAAAFVTLTAMGSAVWVTQPWFNFHFSYAVPMTLYLLHLFLEKKLWRYLFLAGHLLLFQLAGNPPYFLPVILLSVFLYFLFYASLNFREVKQDLLLIAKKRSWLIGFAFLAAFLGAFWIFSQLKLSSMAVYSMARNPDGSVPLPVFLTYGGTQFPSKWLELFLGFSPRLDQSLYIGILGVSFLFASIFQLRRKHLHFFLTCLILLLFSMGTWVAVFLYHVWPLMKFYRPIGLAASFVKLFLCFLAGAGVEAVFNPSQKNRVGRWVAATVTSLLFLALLRLIASPDNLVTLGNWIASHEPGGVFMPLLKQDSLGSLLDRTTGIALCAAILLGFWATGRLEKNRFHLITLMLALHAVDLYGYKLHDAWSKTAPLTGEQQALTRFQLLPYSKNRSPLAQGENRRVRSLSQLPLSGALPCLSNRSSFMTNRALLSEQSIGKNRWIVS